RQGVFFLFNCLWFLAVMSPAGGGRGWKFLQHTEYWSVEYYLNFIHLRHCVTPPPAEDITMAMFICYLYGEKKKRNQQK
ncbi:MAG TPA: hypothetical protein DCR81_00955, partial [Smithella sp.]|nr:hypothetical protein [Smithella sp.]